ncbi:hypothetical protein MRX96_010903 [Rhipicephalus microplus]
MAKGKSRNKGRIEGETPSIRCEGCGRWVFKDETNFEDIDAAEEVEFRCSLCRKIDELESQLACQQRPCTEFRAKIETIEATVREVTVLQLKNSNSQWYVKTPRASNTKTSRPHSLLL